MRKIIFETEIIGYGCDAMEALDQNLLILFGAEVPELIQDLVFIHNSNVLSGDIEEGDFLEVDGKLFEISTVGSAAGHNLSQLGHCTFTFGENPDPSILPGSVYMTAEKAPRVEISSRIRIVKK